jgi:hypothetical protein
MGQVVKSRGPPEDPQRIPKSRGPPEDPEVGDLQRILPRAPPRFASQGLLVAPRSARLPTNSGIYRKDGALS